MRQTGAVPIEPDTKDWTWVLEERCPECAFDAAEIDVTRLPDLLRENAAGWVEALVGPDVAVRPGANIWSRLEYACHVRDVHELFTQRVQVMLTQDDPQFENWDQDLTAIEKQYGDAEPTEVSRELSEFATRAAAVFAGVRADQWERPGRRSNGSVFTIASLGKYYLHDVVHHLHDINR